MRTREVHRTSNDAASDESVALSIAPGTTLGRYVVGHELGRGGMGVVYAAREMETGRTVALKLLAEGVDSATDRARFLREGRIAAAIDHPHVVYVYRTEEIDGRLAIAMELVPEGTLEDKITKRGPLPWEEAVRDTLQMIDGLEAAARLGILHRDIKPSNIFVGARGEMKVGDFGLSRPVDQVEQARLTQTGMFLGTPVCSSPEQLLGEALDVRSDIYAVGATCFFLLTGRYPYEAPNAVQLISQVLNGTPTLPTSVRPDLPQAINAVVMRCIARNRAERIGSYTELRDALEATLPSPVEYARPWRRVIAAWIDFVVSGGVAVLPLSPMFGGQSDPVQGGRTLILAWSLAWLVRGAIEGHFGCAAGKWLLGTRLHSESRRPPGAFVGIQRAAVSYGFAWIPVALALSGDPLPLGTVILWCFVLSIFLPFVRTSSTGGLAENDRLIGGRVVMHRPRRPSRTSEENDQPLTLPGDSCAPRQIGSFTVMRVVHSPDGVLEAREADLDRAVWLVPDSVDLTLGGPVDPVRTTAPRRLSDVEADGLRWRVYPVVDGEPLEARLRRPCPWPLTRQWIVDLADELTVRDDSVASIDLWRGVVITAGDRLVSLPFRLPDRPDLLFDGDAAHPACQLAKALLARETAAATAERPAHATALLCELSTVAPEGAVLKERVLTTEQNTGRVSGTKRALAAAMIVGFASLNSLGVTSDDLETYQRNVMVRFLDASSARVLSTGDGQAALTFAASRVAMSGVPDSVRSIRTERWQWARKHVINVPRRHLLDSLARSIPPSSVDSAAADRRILGALRGTPPGMVNTWLSVSAEEVVDTAVGIWILCLLAAVTVRRGVLLRRLQLEVVSANGTPAHRVRLVLRQLLNGVPLLLTYAAFDDLSAVSISARMVILGVVFASWGALIWSSWRTPARSLVERLSGTWLVRA